MPSNEIKVGSRKLELNARPDRLDLRDRPYNPPLTPLRNQFPTGDEIKVFLPLYQSLILDQGAQGACTGFGLAAVINYQFWFRDIVVPAVRDRRNGVPDEQVILRAKQQVSKGNLAGRLVSPKMLYQLARLYDEWDGEDYEGSSCRGAMRGWHHHGVCLDATWPHNISGTSFEDLEDGEQRNYWLQDAALRPLGAYYRVDTESIPDMQAAIQQVHAIYVSAWVHEGWQELAGRKGAQAMGNTPDPIFWNSAKARLGVHAFAVVGYDAEGLIVQNSWGEKWGTRGFARLSYGDWLANGIDAWASVYGAPTSMVWSPKTKSSGSLQNSAVRAGTNYERRTRETTTPWDENTATLHSIVLGNNGRAMSRLVHAENGDEHLQICARQRILRWCRADRDNNDLVIFANSGLNGEEAALARSAVLGPYFKANGIYPLFLSWTSGVMDDLETLFRDAISAQKQKASGGHLTPSELDRQIKQTSVYTWEAIASGVSIRSVWTERKDNAARAADPRGAMLQLAGHLSELQMAYPELNIHLVGHSAGALLVGSLLKAFRLPKLSAKTVTLWTPACSMQYAAETFVPAVKNGTIARGGLHIETLSDVVEQEDSVGDLYHKSFLYLVSRALEREHKTALLGLEKDWNRDTSLPNLAARGKVMALKNLGLTKTCVNARTMFCASNMAATGRRRIKTSHCQYDHSILAMHQLLKRILGQSPKAKVSNLKGDL